MELKPKTLSIKLISLIIEEKSCAQNHTTYTDVVGFEYKAFFGQQNKMTKWLKQMRELLDNVNNSQNNSTYIYREMED